MVKFISLILGGTIGTLLRYLIMTEITAPFYGGFFWGTLAVNLIGALSVGFAFGMLDDIILTEVNRLFLFTGFFGAFTTFSAALIDVFTLLNIGKIKTALFYLATTNILGILLLFCGFKIAKLLVMKNLTL